MTDSPNVRTESTRLADIRTLGDRVRAGRKALAMTQMDLARELGVGQQTVGRWENGDVPQRRHWAALAAFLGLEGQAEIRSILSADQAGGTVVQLPGSQRLADLRGNDPNRDRLQAAIIERVSHGPLSDAEISFFRDLLHLPEGR